MKNMSISEKMCESYLGWTCSYRKTPIRDPYEAILDAPGYFLWYVKILTELKTLTFSP
jgi:hypothetical protein